MLKYLLKRLFWMVPLLIGISLVSFLIIHLAPGDITMTEAGFDPKASEESRQKLRELYNLDKPVIVQYGLWLQRMAKLDFGTSFASHQRPVFWQTKDKNGNVTPGMIQEALPITLLINVLSLGLIILVALPLGVISALTQNRLPDRAITLFVFVGFAVPGFWLALLLMYWTGVVHDWLPISGLHSQDAEHMHWLAYTWDALKHLVLPVFISALSGLAGISLFVRNGMLDVLHQDYITTARAKGLPEHTVVYGHALRNALLPLITILGLSIPGLIGGSVIAESIFAIPGMGKLFYDAVLMRDFPVIMGILTIGSALTLLGNLMADLAYAWADPRVRRGVMQ
ncbi:ABC transporter permease [Methylobacillus flagellatus]|uniref:Binding-protein-dependent transport systems inner membrane component n=1 Tax=Methylobacillus flagellatus (strain ATCC 51484 / DSM 6875 / VKM B-1610 / KT) TaxID=265072 RepID=Q1H185_METFK|nr:ABC transporter permease [Methylobacillus flagellatus]ABE49752.1 binding-protein-dependent transport systems inner membrane component [Methylobacillus flagellatus KT]